MKMMMTMMTMMMMMMVVVVVVILLTGCWLLDGVVLADWLQRQFSGVSKVLYAKRMFRELFLYLIYLIVLCCGTLCSLQDLSYIS